MSTDNISIGDKLDISKFNLIYCMDYWDYPLTGVCEYDGNLCYFKFIGDVMVANDEMPYAHDTSILPEIQYDVTNLYMVIKLNPVTMKKLVRYNEHFAMCKHPLH